MKQSEIKIKFQGSFTECNYLLKTRQEAAVMWPPSGKCNHACLPSWSVCRALMNTKKTGNWGHAEELTQSGFPTWIGGRRTETFTATTDAEKWKKKIKKNPDFVENEFISASVYTRRLISAALHSLSEGWNHRCAPQGSRLLHQRQQLFLAASICGNSAWNTSTRRRERNLCWPQTKSHAGRWGLIRGMKERTARVHVCVSVC